MKRFCKQNPLIINFFAIAILLSITACGGSGPQTSVPSSSEIQIHAESQGQTLGSSLPLEMVPYGMVNTNPSGRNALNSVPINLTFLRGADGPLTTQPNLMAEKLVEALNKSLQYHEDNNESIQMISFVLVGVKQVVDEEYYYASCPDISFISQRYFTPGVLNVVVNAKLDGICAGVTYLHTHLNQSQSVILLEYESTFEHNNFLVLAHEFGHTVGLPHAAVATEMQGLHKFSDLLKVASSSKLRPTKDFYYYLDSKYNNKNANVNGIKFNSADNIMYYAMANGAQPSFFSSNGYAAAFSNVFDYWYAANLPYFSSSQQN